MEKLLSTFIKENTKDLHQSVEEKMNAQAIFDQNYQLDDYKYLLGMNFRLHQQFEDKAYAALSEDLRSQLNPNLRKKLHLLEKEANELTIQMSKTDIKIPILNEAEALGIIYVMEGSSLGGNVIQKQLKKNPRFETIDFHFFGCYGDKTGENWKSFLEIFNSQLDENQFEDVLTGAQKAYTYLLDYSIES